MEPSAEEDTKEANTPAARKLSASVEEELRKLEQFRAWASELLVPYGPRRVAGNNTEQRCLAIMELELSSIIASLNLQLQNQVEVDERLVARLPRLSHVFLKLAKRRSQTLLERATIYRHRWKSSWHWHPMARFLWQAEHPWMYRHNLLPATSVPGLPPRAADASGVPMLVGISRPIQKLLWWLTPQEKTNRSLRVMCIVGPAGVGKTALAMEIHDRLRCQTSRANYHGFHCNVMVRASRRSDSNQLLLQDMLSKLSDPAPSSDHSTMHLDLLVRNVSERLKKKRYFICIDGMGEDALDWGKIKDAFPDNNLGSRVLITTRTESVAWACCSGSDGIVQKLKPLNQTDSERLLLTRAFGSLDAVLPKNVKLLVDEILMRSGGIPLFITAMANWLKEQFENQRQHQQEEEYQKLASYNEEPAPQLPKQLEHALSSVYYDGLPDGLKFLSLYWSMFPYGYKFDKDRLITKWLCEGLVYFNFDLSVERYYVGKGIAEAYHFSNLVYSNVIATAAANSKSDPDQPEACQWHVNYLFQQFAVFKSAEIGFAFTSTTLKLAASSETDHNNEQQILPRRLAFHHPDPQLPALLQTFDLSQTRSLALSGPVNGIPLDNFVNLVVLDFEGWENLTDEVLLRVCTSNMFFLRYLSIRKTGTSKLPHEIKKLCSLMVLDVSCTQISELPIEVFELALLHELDLRGTRIWQLPKEIVRLQGSLDALLLGGEGMTNPSVTTTKVPHDIQHLSKLRILATVDLGEEPASFIIALGYVEYLHELAITWSSHQCTDRVYSDALIASINRLRHLNSLTIHCGLGCSMAFLDNLCDPPKMLEKLKVTAGRFARVPKWISMLVLLSSVQIIVCKQETEDLTILGALPRLKCLILGLDFIPTTEVAIGNEGFPELETFSIDCPMPWLSFTTGAMPKLIYLQLKFRSTPASKTTNPSGICNLARLTDVVLYYNKHYANSPIIKMTVDAVKKQVAKHRNPIDLFINGTEDYDLKAVDEVAENAVGTKEAESKDDAEAVDGKTHISCEIEEIQSDTYLP